MGRFVYVTQRNGEPEIWLREPSKSDRPLVTPRDFPAGTTVAFTAPELSPDGTRVMYVRSESDARDGTGSHLWMSSLSGGSPMRLRERSSVEHGGSWSPDSAWYAYLEEFPDGTHALKKARTSGTSEPETLALTGGHPSNSVPVWSPDGRWILVDDDGLKLIAADGSETRELGVSNALCAFARAPETLYCIENVTPEGERTLVARTFDGDTRIVGSVAREHGPTASSGPSLRLSLTPDGDGLTYGAGSTRVQLVLAEGLDDIPRPCSVGGRVRQHNERLGSDVSAEARTSVVRNPPAEGSQHRTPSLPAGGYAAAQTSAQCSRAPASRQRLAAQLTARLCRRRSWCRRARPPVARRSDIGLARATRFGRAPP